MRELKVVGWGGWVGGGGEGGGVAGREGGKEAGGEKIMDRKEGEEKCAVSEIGRIKERMIGRRDLRL